MGAVSRRPGQGESASKRMSLHRGMVPAKPMAFMDLCGCHPIPAPGWPCVGTVHGKGADAALCHGVTLPRRALNLTAMTSAHNWTTLTSHTGPGMAPRDLPGLLMPGSHSPYYITDV